MKDQDPISSTRLATLLTPGSSSNVEATKQVETAIRDLFPKIPEADLKSIAQRAFQEVRFTKFSKNLASDKLKGSGRVGTAARLTLERRVQLAVLAHIRHVYTNYDEMLKKGTWQDARRHVERSCIDQLVKWRGEDDSDGHEFEDVFREIIVLDEEAGVPDGSNGNSSETSDYDSDDSNESDDSSIQIISSPKEAHELVEESNGFNGWVLRHSVSQSPYRDEASGRPVHLDAVSHTDIHPRIQKHMRSSVRRQQALRQTFRDRYQAAQARRKEHQLILYRPSKPTQLAAKPEHADQAFTSAQPHTMHVMAYVFEFSFDFLLNR